MTYTFTRDDVPQIDARNNVYYMAAGNSPAMMAKNVGQGSQYLWTYRDAAGEFLQGDKNYRLRVPAESACQQFLVGRCVRCTQQVGIAERSTVSLRQQLLETKANADGSVDIVFGPNEPKGKRNWIKTVPGHGWFPIFRFYGPQEAYFDKTWKLPDIEKEK